MKDNFWRALRLTAVIAFSVSSAFATREKNVIEDILSSPGLPRSVTLFELRSHLLSRSTSFSTPVSAAAWEKDKRQLRDRVLSTLLHGWPQAWIDAAPHFKNAGVLVGSGYRIRKLRYEIVPGMHSAALLYEPADTHTRMPAVLSLGGHYYGLGKAVEWQQKQAITLARHGIMTLVLEWLGCGELSSDKKPDDEDQKLLPAHRRQKINEHWNGAHLNLAGANNAGLFYLAMRRGLDYLYAHPLVDPKLIGATGLSGGGWQTMLLSGLDERVSVAVPVSGYSTTAAKIEARDFGDLGDLEQNAPDLLAGQDYAHLTALRAPRPTLLVNSAEDDCCFRGPLVAPGIYEGIKPLYALYEATTSLRSYLNENPGNHNYQSDNRAAANGFFAEQFRLPVLSAESSLGRELRSYQELTVGLPAKNHNILDLAKILSARAPNVPLHGEEGRAKLREILRPPALSIARTWNLANTRAKGIESRTLAFEYSDRLLADGVWLKRIAAPADAPLTIVLNDKGKEESSYEAAERAYRDEQVLALDPLFFGNAWHEGSNDKWEVWTDTYPFLFAQLMDALGERPLGVQAAQLTAVARWFQSHSHGLKLRVEATGPRSQAVALVAAALEPGLFAELTIREGLRSFRYLFDKPVKYGEAPELFCLDLYKHFDIDGLATLAAPAVIVTERTLTTADSKSKAKTP